MPSYRKLAGALTAGDLVWRNGRYWLVEDTTPIDNDATADLLIHLRHTANQYRRLTWRYRANLDVAVKAGECQGLSR
jgi:hypothetical protein